MSYNKTANGHEHRLVAEKAIGYPLPEDAVVHHIDGDGLNNDPLNLVILASRAEHNSLHYRERAYAATGHAHYVRCEYCKQWDDPDSPDVYVGKRPYIRARHRSCHAMAK